MYDYDVTTLFRTVCTVFKRRHFLRETVDGRYPQSASFMDFPFLSGFFGPLLLFRTGQCAYISFAKDHYSRASCACEMDGEKLYSKGALPHVYKARAESTGKYFWALQSSQRDATAISHNIDLVQSALQSLLLQCVSSSTTNFGHRHRVIFGSHAMISCSRVSLATCDFQAFSLLLDK